MVEKDPSTCGVVFFIYRRLESWVLDSGRKVLSETALEPEARKTANGPEPAAVFLQPCHRVKWVNVDLPKHLQL